MDIKAIHLVFYPVFLLNLYPLVQIGLYYPYISIMYSIQTSIHHSSQSIKQHLPSCITLSLSLLINSAFHLVLHLRFHLILNKDLHFPPQPSSDISISLTSVQSIPPIFYSLVLIYPFIRLQVLNFYPDFNFGLYTAPIQSFNQIYKVYIRYLFGYLFIHSITSSFI